MNEDMIQLVEDILEAASRHKINIPREFEKDSRAGLMSFPGFRAALCKFNKKYSEDFGNMKYKILKILEPFQSKDKKTAKSSDAYKYDCGAFLEELDRVTAFLDTRDELFDKIFSSMQKGRRLLFEELKAKSEGDMIHFDKFKDILKDTSGISLTDEERTAIEYIYGMMEDLDRLKFENGFKARLEQRGRKFDNVTDSKKIDEYKKIIMATFYDYFTRYQILKPINFFKDFGAAPKTDRFNDVVEVKNEIKSRSDFEDNWTISRYSFKEAVYAVMPNIHEEQYQTFEHFIEPNPIGKISLTKFQIHYFETIPTLSKADYSQVRNIVFTSQQERLRSFEGGNLLQNL